LDGVIGGAGQAGEHIVEINQRIDATAAAGFQDGVEDGGLLSGFGGSDKEPVLFSDGGGPD
jgi:hypothetical protein